MKVLGISSDSILVRTGGILLVGMVVSVFVTNIFFALQRGDAIRVVQLNNAAEHLVTLVTLLENNPAADRGRLLRDFKVRNMRVELGEVPMVSGNGLSGEAVMEASLLSQGLAGHDIRVMRIIPPPLSPTDMGGGRQSSDDATTGFHSDGDLPVTLWFSVKLSDNVWLNGFAHFRPTNPPLWRPFVILRLVVALFCLAAVALWAVWRIAKPFGQFTEAADRLGRNLTAPGLEEEGPLEYRQAARAFNSMRERIGRFVEDRTQMVAAISHDLRTPITRLRLRVEFVEDDSERARMIADLDEMERMISATLTFAQDSSAKVERRAVDLASLVQGIAADFAEIGHDVVCVGPETLVVSLNTVSIKRAISNLIENAVKYGSAATVILERRDEDAVIVIKDKGPGIAVGDRERVFSPFCRLEQSRNRETGGSGLGLSIARAAVRAHGGDITLVNANERHPGEQGLWVTVTIPC